MFDYRLDDAGISSTEDEEDEEEEGKQVVMACPGWGKVEPQILNE